MDESIEKRLAAVERALTDGDHDLTALSEAGDVAARVDRLEAAVEEYDDRIAELEAGTQALRGYVGSVRAVNEDVRQRADRALELAESSPDTGSGRADSAEEDPTQTDEPTLELDTRGDRQSVTSSHSSHTGERAAAEQRGGEQQPQRDEARACPLCDDGKSRDTPPKTAGQSIPTNTGGDQSSRHRSPASGRSENSSPQGDRLTDGGTAEQPREEASEDAALLHRIRTLL